MKRSALAFLAAVAVVGPATTAHATSITFDSHAATTNVSGPAPAASIVTNDYASLGIVFGRAGVSAGSAVVDNSNTFSTPNGACGLDAAGVITASCSADQYFNFVDPADGTTAASTNLLSFVIGDSGGDLDEWIVHVYDSSNVQLEARVVASVSNTLQTFVYPDIFRAWIQWTAPHTAGYLLDNLNFNAPTSSGPGAVPEPASLLLLATGGLGLIAKLRSRRKNTQLQA